MSLQITLIVIGLILIAAIYFLSVLLENRKKPIDKSAASTLGAGKNGQHKEEPSLYQLNDTEPQSDKIPVLDAPVMEAQQFAVDIDADGDLETDSGADVETEEGFDPEMVSDKPDADLVETLEDFVDQDQDEIKSQGSVLEDKNSESDAESIDWALLTQNNQALESVNIEKQPEEVSFSVSSDLVESDTDVRNDSVESGESEESKIEQLIVRLQDDIHNENVDHESGEDSVEPDMDITIESDTYKPEIDEIDEIVEYEVKKNETELMDDSIVESRFEPELPWTNDIDSDDGGIQVKNVETMAEVRSSNFIYPQIQGFEKVSQIDYWVKIFGDRDVGRESVFAQYRDAKSKLSKPSHIYGLKVPEKNWCDLENEHEDSRFGDLIVTLQLADQIGPISESELSQFSRLISKLSEGTGREFSFMAPIESALQQANTIADFVRYYESVFVVNIKPEHTEYFDGGTINRCATQLGLERSDQNFFVRNKVIGKGKVCLYSLANMSDTGKFDFENLKELSTRGVTFFTKPAVNRSPGAVFSEMVDTAKAFAGRIKGEAIAPNHDDLSQDDIEQTRQSIENVARDMESQGMAPGSNEAMRIF